MKVVEKICDVLSWFSSAATVAMMACVLIDVFSRMIFGKPLTGLTEIVTMLITCSFASFGATVLANKHVKIDILVSIFPEKVIKVIDFFSLLLCFLLCVLLTWRTFVYAFYAKSMNLGYITLDFPYWPFIMLFAVGFGAGALAIVCKIIMLFKGTPDVPINEVDQILQEAQEHDQKGKEKDMKKLIALILATVMVFAMAGAVMAEEIPEGYTQVKVFDGTYGFGDAEISVASNDDFSTFYITFVCFDEDQILEGTVEDGICSVDYDLTGFVAGDCQLIWDDAMASENPWEPIGGAAAEEAPAEEAAEEAVEEAAEYVPAEIDYAFDRSWPEEELKIAMAVYDTTDEQFLAMQEYNSYIEENFNVKFMYSESIASAEDEMAFVDAAAASGCKAYFGYYNMADVETIKQCQAHGMYYAGGVGGVGYEQRPDLADYDNYVGSNLLVGEDANGETNGNYLAGYSLGKTMAEKGYQHIAYCEGGAAFGVQQFIDRKSGFLDGLAAAGYDHFTDADIVSGWPGTDEFAAQQTAVIAGDYDAVVSSFNVAMWFQPVMESGKQIALAAIGEANETYKDFFDMGIVQSLVYDCEEAVFCCIVPMLINAATGYEDMTRLDGAPLVVPVSRWNITEAEQIDAIYEYHAAGNYFVSAEDFANTLKGLNPAATSEIYEQVFNLTLDEALAKIR